MLEVAWQPQLQNLEKILFPQFDNFKELTS